MRELVAKAARSCPTELAMEVVGGKWKIVVLEHLAGGTLRFGELRRALPGVTARMLTRQLRELETDGVVHRTVHAEVPPRVEYRLTEPGRDLLPVIAQLREWGEAYRLRATGPVAGPVVSPVAGPSVDQVVDPVVDPIADPAGVSDRSR